MNKVSTELRTVEDLAAEDYVSIEDLTELAEAVSAEAEAGCEVWSAELAGLLTDLATAEAAEDLTEALAVRILASIPQDNTELAGLAGLGPDQLTAAALVQTLRFYTARTSERLTGLVTILAEADYSADWLAGWAGTGQGSSIGSAGRLLAVTEAAGILARIILLAGQDLAEDLDRADLIRWPAEDRTAELAELLTELAEALRCWLAEARLLAEVLTELAGYGGDHNWAGVWYPHTLIRDRAFKGYCQDLAEDCGMIPKDLSWPASCIDWDQAAAEAEADYSSIDWAGRSWLYR